MLIDLRGGCGAYTHIFCKRICNEQKVNKVCGIFLQFLAVGTFNIHGSVCAACGNSNGKPRENRHVCHEPYLFLFFLLLLFLSKQEPQDRKGFII
jgi:hypothetical protein